MHTFERLEELISNLAESHANAARLYLKLKSRTDSQRLLLLLGDMSEKELRLEKLIAEFLEKADQGTRTSYLQYSLEESFQKLTNRWETKNPPLQLEDITSLGLALHQYQVDLLEGALREISSMHAQELLEDLLQLEKAEQRSFTQEVMSSYEL